MSYVQASGHCAPESAGSRCVPSHAHKFKTHWFKSSSNARPFRCSSACGVWLGHKGWTRRMMFPSTEVPMHSMIRVQRAGEHVLPGAGTDPF
ncbi:hypothetical protein HaLaN_25459 [Haematococcus lacustris]|uniref:Uncharacterized protein n=1 Tax=Haematococcus lacustris TaxID=44745 RepID=A0A699ZXK7_HAELA|nr:hypothetical protein HaLaN_25459 [Haematococcus lacustris]